MEKDSAEAPNNGCPVRSGLTEKKRCFAPPISLQYRLCGRPLKSVELTFQISMQAVLIFSVVEQRQVAWWLDQIGAEWLLNQCFSSVAAFCDRTHRDNCQIEFACVSFAPAGLPSLTPIAAYGSDRRFPPSIDHVFWNIFAAFGMS